MLNVKSIILCTSLIGPILCCGTARADQSSIEGCLAKHEYSDCFAENLNDWTYFESLENFKFLYQKADKLTPRDFRILSRLFFYIPFRQSEAFYSKMKKYHSINETDSLFGGRDYLKILYSPNLLNATDFVEQIKHERMKIFFELQKEKPRALTEHCEKAKYEYDGRLEQSFLFYCVFNMIKLGKANEAKNALESHIEMGPWINFTYHFLCKRLDKGFKKTLSFNSGTLPEMLWQHHFSESKSQWLHKNINPTGLARFYESFNRRLLISKSRVRCN